MSVDQMRMLLDELRETIGPSPRRLGVLARLRLRARPPSWFRRTDKLWEVFRRQDLLLREGDVVWGALVQANRLLFEAGPSDHPAIAIYSTDRFFDDALAHLQAIARRLYRLKGTTPEDPNERRLAELITGEQERGMGWVVPKSCTEGREVRSTTLMIFRRHLPGGVLQCGWFPLLIHPETSAVMIVPWKYWPLELVRLWSERGEVA